MTFRGSTLRAPLATSAGLAVVFAATLLVPALTSREVWVGWLPTTMGASEVGAVWLTVVASGVGVLMGGRERALGVTDLASTSPRTAEERMRPRLLPAALALIVGQLLATGVIAWVSVAYGLEIRAERDMFLIIVSVTFYGLFWLSVGALFGIAVPGIVALPLALILPYATFAALSYYVGDGALSTLAVGDGRIYDYVRPSAATIVARTTFWGLASTAVLALLLIGQRSARWLRWTASFALAVAIFQGVAFVPIAGAEETTCTGRGPITCLDRSHATAMPRYRSAVEELTSSIPRAVQPRVVSGVEAGEASTGPGDDVLVVPPVAGFTQPSRVVDAVQFASRFGEALFMTPCRPLSGGSGAGVDEMTTLNVWWRLIHDLPLDGSAFAGDTNLQSVDPNLGARISAARRLDEWPVQRREAWFTANAQAIFACDKLSEAFP